MIICVLTECILSRKEYLPQNNT